MNTVILVGYLGGAPDAKVTRDGLNLSSFSVAVEEKNGKDKATIWFKVTAFGKLAEICAQYLGKGSHVYVQGAFRRPPNIFTNRQGEAATSLEIVADKIHFLSPKGDTQGSARPNPSRQQNPLPENGMDDEEIPF